MLVEKWSSRPQLPEVHARSAGADQPREGAEPREDEVPARLARTSSRTRITRSPWSVVAPNIDLNITDFPTYHGEATFHGGTVAIQEYLPMWVEHEDAVPPRRQPRAPDAARLRHRRLAELPAVGVVDFSRFPEMTYDVKSRVDFPRMREIFFQKENWALSGDGRFHGDVSSLQGRARSGRHVHQRGRRRLRLPLSAAVRLASLDAEGCSRSPRPDRSSSAATRALRIRSSLSGRRAARPRGSRRRTRTSISPR